MPTFSIAYIGTQDSKDNLAVVSNVDDEQMLKAMRETYEECGGRGPGGYYHVPEMSTAHMVGTLVSNLNSDSMIFTWDTVPSHLPIDYAFEMHLEAPPIECSE